MNANKPYRLGLTGGIASGKTEVAKRLSEMGATIIDADEISRSLTAKDGALLPQIRERFGDAVFNEDGTLNRKALGEVVFSDEWERRALEGIIHPAVQSETFKKIAEAQEQGAVVCALVVPLLYETAMDAMCEEVWVTSVESEEQLRRLMQRDNLTAEQARARMRSQLPEGERERLADLVIKTNRPIDQTRKEVKRLYEALLKRIEERNKA